MSAPREPFTGVLFDCDGVLVDSETVTNSVLREMLAELGWEMSEAEGIERFIGKVVKAQTDVIFAHTGHRIDDTWITEFRARRDVRLRASVTPIPGADQALAAVAERFGTRFACASGADRPKIEMQLAITGLAHWFGTRVFSGLELPRSKPAPDVYLAAADAIGRDPARCLVIEDSRSGVHAGVAAGATVFAYSPGTPVSTPPDLLREAGATRVFADMAALPGLIDEWGAQDTGRGA